MTRACAVLAIGSEMNVLAKTSEVAVAEESKNPGNAFVFGVRMVEVQRSATLS